MARTLAKNLERAGHTVSHAANGEAALGVLANESFDVILTDLKMPVLDGMGLLRALHERGIGTAVIVLTGYGTIESAVEAMKLGAADYLIKDARPQEVLLTIERTLKLQALERENARLRNEIGRFEGIGELVGSSEAMQAVYRLVDAVTQTQSTVVRSRPSGVDVRLIAAANRDMDAEVRAGRFRADLFYRLNVVHIEVPPLRARRDDIPVLVGHFLELYSARYRVAPKRIAPDALARITAYDWPGNVRELQNAIERAFALSASDVITEAELPPVVAGRPSRFPLERTDGSLPTLAEAEARLVAAALAESAGNKNEAARRLGIDRQRLYRKVTKYGL